MVGVLFYKTFGTFVVIYQSFIYPPLDFIARLVVFAPFVSLRLRDLLDAIGR